MYFRHFSVVLLLMCFNIVAAQFITHGPMIGGVTHTGSRVYIRTDIPRNFELQYSADSTFAAFQTINSATEGSLDNSKITDIGGLQPSTVYFVRFVFDNTIDGLQGRFKTFPNPGEAAHLKFVTGSCQETPNMKVFDVMPRHQPDLFIHTGDFTYPSYQIPDALGYPQEWSSIELAWRKRNEEPVCKDMLRRVPIAYMPDDDDTYDGNSRWFRAGGASIRYEGNKLINYFNLYPRTPEMRENCFKGYEQFFPGYPVVNDTDGYYHSFMVGNCEFFMLDTRSCNTGGWNSLEYNEALNFWFFNGSKASQSILGEYQLNWFLNKLKNSTATWKFIVTGVPFNQNIQKFMEAPLLLQGSVFDIGNQQGTGFRLAYSFSDYWASYPIERKKVLKFINDNNIENVIVISGDTHGCGIDDGRNAGLPEMNASGLSVTSTELYFQFNNILSVLGLDLKRWLWNQGGMGIDNDNIKNAFGQMEVFGNDSVQLCIFDEDDVRIACYTVKNTAVPTGVNPNLSDGSAVQLFPNPAQQQLQLNVSLSDPAEKIVRVGIYDVNGKLVQSISGLNRQQTISVAGLSKGVYAVRVETERQLFSQLFVKE